MTVMKNKKRTILKKHISTFYDNNENSLLLWSQMRDLVIW